MKRPVSSVRANASWSFGISGAYCALTSTWGIDMAGGHRSRAAPTECPVRDACHDHQHDRNLDVAEVVVKRLPVRAEGPPGTREHKAPERVAECRQHVVAAEGALEHAGRDRHERSCDGRDAAKEDGPGIPAL